MEQKKYRETNWKEQIYNIYRSLCARLPLICLIAILAAVGADLYYTLTYRPLYETNISAVIGQNGYSSGENGEDSEIAEALNYILSSNVFLDKVKEELKTGSLEGTYHVKGVPGTNIVKISARAESPQISYRMMYAMMNRYEEVTRLVIGNAKMQIIDKIQVPKSPCNQISHWKNFLLFGGTGLLAAVIVFSILSYSCDTVKEKQDIKDKLQIRLLGSIVNESKIMIKRGKLYRKKGILITQMTTGYVYIESFMRLCHRFLMQMEKKEYHTVVINSVLENEGKTSVIVNLGIVLAQQGKKVLLVDTDIKKPALAKLLDIENYKGFEEALKNDEDIDEVLYRHKRLNLDLVLGKEAVKDSSALLEKETLQEWIQRKKKEYDYILLDTSPCGYTSDALLVASCCDAVLFVVRQDFAPTALLNRMIGKYLFQETPVIGAVLNRSMPVRIPTAEKEKKKEMYYGTAGRYD